MRKWHFSNVDQPPHMSKKFQNEHQGHLRFYRRMHELNDQWFDRDRAGWSLLSVAERL
jgi:arylsulfatase A-like enzyme